MQKDIIICIRLTFEDEFLDVFIWDFCNRENIFLAKLVATTAAAMFYSRLVKRQHWLLI